MNHDTLVEKAKEVIGEVFSDRSVSLAETQSSLQDLKLEIDIRLDAIDENLLEAPDADKR